MKSLNDYEKGKVLLLEDLLKDGFTKEELDNLVKLGDLCQSDLADDVYYINDPYEFMDIMLNTEICPSQIINAKYLGNDWKYGFLYEYTALNRIGACTQVPFVTSICSTKVEKYTEITLGKQKFCIFAFSEEYGGIYDNQRVGFYIADVVFNKLFDWIDYELDFVVSNFKKAYGMSIKDILSVVSNKKAIKQLEVLN